MFGGQYYCKLDEKGRFIIPTPLREQVEGDRVIFVKPQDRPLTAYSVQEWEKVLVRVKETFDEDQSRLFMHYIVAESTSSEIDKTGRVLIPGRLRKVIPLEDDLEIVAVGILHRFEIWNPSEWRLYLKQKGEQLEETLAKMYNLL